MSAEMSLKEKRVWVRIGLHGITLSLLFLLMSVLDSAGYPTAAGVFALLFLVYLVTLKVNPFARAIEVRLIREAQCTACGEVIDLVNNVWACGCGFQSWEPRHALSSCPGPGCGKSFQWLCCPNCDATIPT